MKLFTPFCIFPLIFLVFIAWILYLPSYFVVIILTTFIICEKSFIFTTPMYTLSPHNAVHAQEIECPAATEHSPADVIIIGAGPAGLGNVSFSF
jgi:hypothetical protein